MLFDNGAKLQIPIIYSELTKVNGDSKAQKILPQQDTLDLEVSYAKGNDGDYHYYLSEIGKPINTATNENGESVLTINRTIDDKTYSTTFTYTLKLDTKYNEDFQSIGQRTNGSF